MLSQNEGSVETSNTYIAQIFVQFNLRSDNYRKIYAQYSKVFVGWPNPRAILEHYPEIKKMIDKLYEAKWKRKKRKRVNIQAWYKEMLSQNVANVEAIHTIIAETVVRFKVTTGN